MSAPDSGDTPIIYRINKPLLTVVTGRPASGKTRLAQLKSREIHCPVLSRDAIKEGYLNTLKTHHDPGDNSADLYIYATFFEIIDLLVSKGISMIVEAAFQNKLWTKTSGVIGLRQYQDPHL